MDVCRRLFRYPNATAAAPNAARDHLWNEALIAGRSRVRMLLLAIALPILFVQNPPVEKLGDNLFRIGNIRVDTAKREISVAGKVNRTTALEFIANTKGGMKAYESAFSMDTDAVMFNTALILIGLDKGNGVPTKFHFDPDPPKGDRVEIWVEWTVNGATKKLRAEEVVWNANTKQTLPAGQWVYTGSVFLDDGRYLADRDGVLIGFVHTPAPIIERTAFERVNYGAMQLNSALGLTPDLPVTLSVRAIPKN